ncbi:MAG: hypothetical protein AB1468_00370 [Candidatus Micrarchaeota archaeon]
MLDPLELEKEKSLVAGEGVVFLLVVGREEYAENITGRVTPVIVKNKATVYQYASDLKKKKLIKETRKIIDGVGQPKKLLTADLNPIYRTISNHRLAYKNKPPYFGELDKKEKKQFKKLFDNLNGILDAFPDYLRIVSFKSSEKKWRSFLKQLKWNETLSYFFEFCREVVLGCWRKKTKNDFDEIISMISIRRRNYEDSLNDFLDGKELDMGEIGLLRAFFVPYCIELLKRGNIRQISTLTRGEEDMFRNTFLSELFFISLALKDPHLAGIVREFRDKAIVHAKNISKKKLSAT